MLEINYTLIKSYSLKRKQTNKKNPINANGLVFASGSAFQRTSAKKRFSLFCLVFSQVFDQVQTIQILEESGSDCPSCQIENSLRSIVVLVT